MRELKSKQELLEKLFAGNEKQHKSGKLTAEERIERFFDKGTFKETGFYITHKATKFGMQGKVIPRDGVITGSGLVNGRRVFAAIQDFRAAGGTVGRAHATKIMECIDTARKVGCPFVFVADSGGARIQEGVDALSGFGDIFHSNVQASGVIPQISVILGPCAGGAVYSPALTDFVFTVRGVSGMFITGPDVIRAVTGEVCDMQTLGGADVHSKTSGVAHFALNNEDECFQTLRELLLYLPQNNLDGSTGSTKNYVVNQKPVSSIVPLDSQKGYDVKEVIKSLSDDGKFFEVQGDWANNITVGFAKIGGASTAIIANNPLNLSGCLDVNASDKAARFIRFADCYNIPILTLVDVPGFLPGVKQEHDGIIRHGAKVLYAYCEATSPKVTVILRKAYGGAYIAMCSKHVGADFVYATKNSEIAVMGAEGACNIIFSKEIKSSLSPEIEREKKVREYKSEMMNPYMAAESGWIDDIIDFDEIRDVVLNSFDILKTKNVSKINKKHGNIPL